MHISTGSLTTAALVGAVLLAPTVAFSIDFDKCGSFECDGNGCVIFRADDGTPYELIVPGAPYEPKYTPDHRACIIGTLDSGRTPTYPGVTGCVAEARAARLGMPRIREDRDDEIGEIGRKRA